MLLTGISYAPAKNYSSRQLKNNPSNQALKDTQAKSNFGLYNLSSRYGISFGNKIHSNESTIKERHDGDSPYTSEDIAIKLMACLNSTELTDWVKGTANTIAGLGFGNKALNNLFDGIEIMAGNRNFRNQIYKTCDCINSDNKDLVEKIFSATYKSNGKDKPYVFAYNLPEILNASEGKEDILDIILSAKIRFKNGNECPLVDSMHISTILEASTPENKGVLEEYLKKASEDKERNSDCFSLSAEEVIELVGKLTTYVEYTPEKIAGILNKCIERAHLYHIHSGWPEETANRIAGLGFSNELLNNFFYGIEKMSRDYYWSSGIYNACECINSDNKKIVEKLLNATYKSNGKNLPTVFPHYLKAIINSSKGKEDILDIILSAKVSSKDGNECPLVDSRDISMILKASTSENKEFLEDYLKKASEDKERNSAYTCLNLKEVRGLIDGLKTYTD